jgi:hypothetical protein
MRLTDVSFEAQGFPCEFLPRRRVVAECHGDGQFLVLDVLFRRGRGNYLGVLTNFLDAAACRTMRPVAQF